MRLVPDSEVPVLVCYCNGTDVTLGGHIRDTDMTIDKNLISHRKQGKKTSCYKVQSFIN